MSSIDPTKIALNVFQERLKKLNPDNKKMLRNTNSRLLWEKRNSKKSAKRKADTTFHYNGEITVI